jgi:oxalate decarboxylase/phosphoglucose isomerase-like protein (cupin superfamily)
MEMENRENALLAPHVQTPNQSQPIQLPGGGSVRILATSAQTGNAMGTVEVTLPPGGGARGWMHIHKNEDEWVYVLEGKLLCIVGDTRIEAEAGTFIYGPRNIAHGLRPVGSAPTRFIESFLPAGLEELFSNPNELVTYLTEGRSPVTEKYNVEVVGPMPE